MLEQKFSLFFMSAVECLVAIYAVLHLIENVNKNCAISHIYICQIIFTESRIPYFWVLHVAKKYQLVNKLFRIRFRKHEVIHPKKYIYGEPLRHIAREEFKLVRIMLKCNSYPKSPPNQTLNQIKIKSSPEESNGETETSKNYRFKNKYGRSKNIALPFHFAMHFAIAGICRQLLNSMDLVLRCAWQKVKNKS